MNRILEVVYAGTCPLTWTHVGATPKPNSLSSQEIADGWIPLFDGQTLFDWAPRGSARWTVAYGTISCSAGMGGYPSTEFADFQWHAVADEKVNSGLFLRCQGLSGAGGRHRSAGP